MHLSGELNLMRGRRSESDKPASNEGRGMKVPVVTGMRPEAVRSTPGQAEARVKPRGGPQRFYVQVFF